MAVWDVCLGSTIYPPRSSLELSLWALFSYPTCPYLCIVFLTVGNPLGAFPTQPTVLHEMSNIHFTADAIYRVHSTGAAGGIYSTRNHSSPPSIAEKHDTEHKAYVLDGKDEENGLRQEGDLKQKQVSTINQLVYWNTY